MRVLRNIALVVLISPIATFGQTDSTRFRIICGTPTGMIYAVNGNIFSPKNPGSNKSQFEIKFCDGSKHIYYLEGLQLVENKFLEIGIKRKDILEKKSVFTYQYKNHDTTSCVEFINLFVSVSIPIRLNGMELKDDEKESVLNKIRPEQLVTIKRVSSFFRKDFIEIRSR